MIMIAVLLALVRAQGGKTLTCHALKMPSFFFCIFFINLLFMYLFDVETMKKSFIHSLKKITHEYDFARQASSVYVIGSVDKID